MNSWFERYLQALGAEGLALTPEEAKLALELAGEVAHAAGARQYAPLATYLAGRATSSGDDPITVLQAATRAAAAAGAAGGPLGVD